MSRNAPLSSTRQPLVGRTLECGAVDEALATLGARRAGVVDVVGEPGIGKTALLDHAAAQAAGLGALVLRGAAAELEATAPFAVFTDAIDAHLKSVDRERLADIGDAELTELASVFPSVGAVVGGAQPVPANERYRLHRAVRSLLERLAAPSGLVLILDDVHWCDPASAELLAALIRRPADAAVLIVLGHRPAIASALRIELDLATASRANGWSVQPGRLSRADADALILAELGSHRRDEVFRESGGNPFFLLQLARHDAGSGTRPGVGGAPAFDGIPVAVAASLAAEFAPLSTAARAMLRGGAIVGDPFEFDLAATAADLVMTDAAPALDELVAAELVGPADGPRAFRFRHPLVRRAVLASIPSGWALAAHGRAAHALEQRGADPAARAQHVRFSAEPGDAAAATLLATAAGEVSARAPEAAADWLQVAVGLLPTQGPAGELRANLLPALGLALAQVGRLEAAHEVLVESLDGRDPLDPLHVLLTIGCAAIERLQGRFDAGERRLVSALGATLDNRAIATQLRLALALHLLVAANFDRAAGYSTQALADATQAGDSARIATATAQLALAAGASKSQFAEAMQLADDADTRFAALEDADLGPSIDGLFVLGWADWMLGRFAAAAAHFSRALTIARATGRAMMVIELMAGQAAALRGAGRAAEASEVVETALEEAQLVGNEHTLMWAHLAHCTVLEVAGDAADAVRAGERSLAAGGDFADAMPAAATAGVLANALVALGEGARAAQVILDGTGGPDLPRCFAASRATAYEILVRAELVEGRIPEAERWMHAARDACGDGSLPFAVSMAERAEAAVLLARGHPERAATVALAAAERAAECAPIESSRSLILAARAFERSGDRDRAAAALRRAETALLVSGAERIRGEAARELRRIGRRVNRRGRGGRPDVRGVAALSSREREIAGLAADGVTNREIAARLFLSEKTVETHLSNAFVKLGVRGRRQLPARLSAPEAAIASPPPGR